MNLSEVIFTDNLPTIDLHGFDRDYARIKVLEFINDNIILKKDIIVIVHGIGNGILKTEVHKILKRSNKVLDYKLFYNNNGLTIVKLRL